MNAEPQEIQSVARGSCPACGAQAEWDPSKRALLCPYCGTEAPGELDTDSGKIREIDLVRTLREIPEELRGWQADRKSVKCRNCHAVSVFDAARVGQNCEFCGSPELVDYEEIKAPIRPQSVLPFTVDEHGVRTAIRRWLGGKWLAPRKLKKAAWVDTVRGVYLPYWTFDSHAAARWTAESGTYYYTAQTYRGVDGKTHTRQVRHTRWRPASGSLDHFFDDEPVPGTHGVRVDLLRRIEPFPTDDLVPYDTAYLSGFVVEHYQVVLIDAARQARESMERKLRDLCVERIPGDTYRDLRIDAQWSGETFKHILVPVWILTYAFGRKTYRLLTNGSTGSVAGDYPKSALKITLLVLGTVIAVAAFALFVARS